MLLEPEARPAPEPLLEARGLWKSFPGVVAVQDVSFAAHGGQVLGIVGENGAGKSTLMRILAGFHPPDRGKILLHGQEVRIASPAHARQLGISMVYQEPKLAPSLTVAENVWLGNEPVGPAGWVDRRSMRERTEAILRRFGMPLDPDAPASRLSVAERQVVEIVKALSIESQVVIFDEPTAALEPTESERLFAIIGQLKEEGKAVLYISHRLPEVRRITDRVIVMKDGRLVGDMPTAEADEDRLVQLMVGRRMVSLFPPRPDLAPSRDPNRGLRLQGLGLGRAFRDVTLHVAPGEIVGLAGIEGAGQRDIVRAIAGVRPASEGQMWLDGQPLAPRNPKEASQAGIVYLSNDRRRESVILPLSVAHNVALPSLARWQRWGLVDRQREQTGVHSAVETLQIRTPSPEQPVEYLSGGNQQKVVLGKWFLINPRVIIFDEPTQGVDVASKAEIYRLVRQLASEGASVLVVSSDHLELIGLCDRICVVSEGRIVQELPAPAATEEAIVRASVTRTGKGPAEEDRGEQGRGEQDGGGTGRPETPAEARGEAGARASHPNAPGTGDPAIGGKPGTGGMVRWPLGSTLGSTLGSMLGTNRWLSAWVVGAVLTVLIIVAASQSPYFLGTSNIASLLRQSIPLALVALGQTLVLLVGGIDLSVGATTSLMTVIASYLIVGDAPGGWLAATLFLLAVGALIGWLNATAIRILRIPDLIATLAMMSIVQGVALILRPGPGGLVSFDYADLIQHQWGWLPVAVLPVFALLVGSELWLQRTRGGLRLYATGSNREAAYISGVSIHRVRTWAYVSCGILAGLAGVFLATRIGSGDPNAGSAFTLTSVTAAVVGGTSIFGGKGTVTGTVLGVLTITVMNNLLNLAHVSPYYQYMWTGLLTVLAVGVYSFQERSV